MPVGFEHQKRAEKGSGDDDDEEREKEGAAAEEGRERHPTRKKKNSFSTLPLKLLKKKTSKLKNIKTSTATPHFASTSLSKTSPLRAQDASRSPKRTNTCSGAGTHLGDRKSSRCSLVGLKKVKFSANCTKGKSRWLPRNTSTSSSTRGNSSSKRERPCPARKTSPILCLQKAEDRSGGLSL